VLLLGCCLGAPYFWAQQPEVRTSFRVKYVAEGAVYLEGGSSAGLVEGQKLVVKRSGTTALASGSGQVQATRIIAQLEVVSVAEASAVCEVLSANGPLRAGDIATVVADDARALAKRRDPACQKSTARAGAWAWNTAGWRAVPAPRCRAPRWGWSCAWI
jgi:hypothetical protein